jgi:hypothetical protein
MVHGRLLKKLEKKRGERERMKGLASIRPDFLFGAALLMLIASLAVSPVDELLEVNAILYLFY